MKLPEFHDIWECCILPEGGGLIFRGGRDVSWMHVSTNLSQSPSGVALLQK